MCDAEVSRKHLGTQTDATAHDALHRYVHIALFITRHWVLDHKYYLSGRSFANTAYIYTALVFKGCGVGGGWGISYLDKAVGLR